MPISAGCEPLVLLRKRRVFKATFEPVKSFLSVQREDRCTQLALVNGSLAAGDTNCMYAARSCRRLQ